MKIEPDSQIGFTKKIEKLEQVYTELQIAVSKAIEEEANMDVTLEVVKEEELSDITADVRRRTKCTNNRSLQMQVHC